MTGRSARPCRGPHDCRKHPDAAVTDCRTCPPITADPLCRACRAKLVAALTADTPGSLVELFIRAYIAAEPGQRPRRERGGKAPRRAEAPLPIDPEADALQRRILEIVLSWHAPVVAAAGLTRAPARLAGSRWRRYMFTMAATDLEADGVLIERAGPSQRIEPVHVSRPVERAGDGTAGTALVSTCALLLAHLDTLLGLPAQPVTRTVERHQVLRSNRAPIPTLTEHTTWTTVAAPQLDDQVIGTVLADGRALVIRDLDGVDAAIELLELQRHAERILGHTRGGRYCEAPCGNDECPSKPAQPGGRQERTLWLANGADFIECRACGRRTQAKDYPRLVLILAEQLQAEQDTASGL